MIIVWLKFFFLLSLIAVAANLLSVNSEKIANKIGANFTGSVILGLITTLPEYLFVVWACVKGQYDVGLGSAVGAASMLVTLGYGMVIIVSTTRLSKKPVQEIKLSKGTKVDSFYLNFTALLALVLAYIGDGLGLIDGIILVACFVVYVYHSWHDSKKHMLEKVSNGEEVKKLGPWPLIWILVGAVIVVVASEPFVDSMIEIAHGLGVHPIAVAIILSPIASEMPEKLTAFLTVRRNGALAEISVCNFIGSKINHNSLLIGMLPIVAFLKGDGFVGDVINIPFMMMTVLTVFAGISVARQRLSKWQGFVFVALFIVPILTAYFSR